VSTQNQGTVTTGRRLLVDADRCAGHGRCFSLEPELFDSDDAGYPVVRREIVADDLVPNAQEAVANCPESAITLRDEG
jgi:ferredoxin